MKGVERVKPLILLDTLLKDGPPRERLAHHRSCSSYWLCLGPGGFGVTFFLPLCISRGHLCLSMWAAVLAELGVEEGNPLCCSPTYSLSQGLSVKLRTHRRCWSHFPVCVGVPCRLELQTADHAHLVLIFGSMNANLASWDLTTELCPRPQESLLEMK